MISFETGAPLFLDGGSGRVNNGPVFGTPAHPCDSCAHALPGRFCTWYDSPSQCPKVRHLSLEHTKEAQAVTYQVWAQQVTTVALCGTPIYVYPRRGDDGPFDI